MNQSNAQTYEIVTFRPRGIIASDGARKSYFYEAGKPSVELKSLTSVKTVAYEGESRVQVQLVPKVGPNIVVIVSALGARKLREALGGLSVGTVSKSQPSQSQPPGVSTFLPITSFAPAGRLEIDSKGRFRFKYAGLFGEKVELGILSAARKLVDLGKGQVRVELVTAGGEIFHIVTKEKASDKIIGAVEDSAIYYSKGPARSSGSVGANPDISTNQEGRGLSRIFGIPNHWKQAESLAAKHMEDLGFQSVLLSGAGSDGGIDISAQGAAAQVKFRSSPTGSPEIQQFGGAALQFRDKLFYSNSYTAKAVVQADALGIALFIFSKNGEMEPSNSRARALSRSRTAPVEWSDLSLVEKRQRYIFDIAQLVDHIQTHKIDDSDRKARKDLEKRSQALALLVQAEAALGDVFNPIYSTSRQGKKLSEAARLIHAAKQLLAY